MPKLVFSNGGSFPVLRLRKACRDPRLDQNVDLADPRRLTRVTNPDFGHYLTSGISYTDHSRIRVSSEAAFESELVYNLIN